MKPSFFYALALGLLPLSTARQLVKRQPAGSASTTSIPSDILTAGPDQVSQTTMPTDTATSFIDIPTTAETTSTPTATDDSTSADPTATGTLEKCQNTGGAFAPFCMPTNGSTLTSNHTYYVTWDSSYFADDADVVIEVSYANSSTKSGTSVYSSGKITNSDGYASIDIKEAWLQDEDTQNNVTFYIAKLDTTGATDTSATFLPGPTVVLTKDGASTSDQTDTSGSPLASTPGTKANGSHLGLVVGLTIGIALLILLCTFCLFFSYRRYQNKNRGYGIRKSRSQRLGDEQQHNSWYGRQRAVQSPNTGNVRLGEMEAT